MRLDALCRDEDHRLGDGTIIRGKIVARDDDLLDRPIGEPVRFLETLQPV